MTDHNTDLLTPPPSNPTGLSRLTFIATLAGFLLVGLVLGGIIGTAAASGAHSAPQPTKAVEVEVPAAVEVGTCRDVAIELQSIAQGMVSDVAVPQNEIIQTLVGVLQTGDYTDVAATTTKMQGVTADINDLTDRVAVLRSDYDRCVNP